MHARADPVAGEVPVIDAVGPNRGDRRAVDRLQAAGEKVGRDLRRALDAACADDVEELGREFRKEGADAAAGDNDRAASAEVKRKLPHPVEVDLQAGEEDQIVATIPGNVERPVPVLVVQADVEPVLADQRGDVQAADRLHDVTRPALVAPRPQMGAHDKGLQLGAPAPSVPRRVLRRVEHREPLRFPIAPMSLPCPASDRKATTRTRQARQAMPVNLTYSRRRPAFFLRPSP